MCSTKKNPPTQTTKHPHKRLSIQRALEEEPTYDRCAQQKRTHQLGELNTLTKDGPFKEPWRMNLFAADCR